MIMVKNGRTKHTAGLFDAMGFMNELWIYIRHELRTKVHKMEFRMMELWSHGHRSLSYRHDVSTSTYSSDILKC